jgi:hypothetical protein
VILTILSRSALQGASFTSVKMLIEATETFIASWNQYATPFENQSACRPSGLAGGKCAKSTATMRRSFGAQ